MLTFSPPPQAASQRESCFAGQPKTAKNVRRNGTAKIFKRDKKTPKSQTLDRFDILVYYIGIILLALLNIKILAKRQS